MILKQLDTWPSWLMTHMECMESFLVDYRRIEEEIWFEHFHRKGNYVPTCLMRKNPLEARYNDFEEHLDTELQKERFVGWHCTRLTDFEVDSIVANGMRLSGLSLLNDRINRIEADGGLPTSVADRLKADNLANDSNRRNMIWFVFFDPKDAGQHGLEVFFRYWGGEALYGRHHQDPETAMILQSIGTPCLVEAEVPVAAFGNSGFHARTVANNYLSAKSHSFKLDCSFENYSVQNIGPDFVRRVIRSNESHFMQMTESDRWKPRVSFQGFGVRKPLRKRKSRPEDT